MFVLVRDLTKSPSLPRGERSLLDPSPARDQRPARVSPYSTGGRVVPVAPGKHRRSEAEPPQAPGRMPLSTTGYLPAPAGAAGPDSDWLTDADGVSWPQFNSPPPMLHPDHPSAPVPRVRDPGRPDPKGGPPRLPQRQPGARPNPGSPRPRGS